MKPSLLLSLLQSLSRAEQKRFALFVQSPFFNQNQRLIKLNAHLLSSLVHTKEMAISAEALHKKLYPKQPFVAQHIYDLFSQLLRLLKQFLAQQQYEQDTTGQERYLLDDLMGRKAWPHFTRVHKRASKQYAQSKVQDAGHFYRGYLLAQRADRFFGLQQKRKTNDDLNRALGELDRFYLMRKLELSCELLNRQNIVQADAHSEMMPVLNASLQDVENPYRAVPGIAIYHQIYLTLYDSTNEHHYERLIASLHEYSHLFSQAEANQMYAYAQNYCVKQINQGQSAYLQKLFDVYRSLIEKGLLLQEGQLHHGVYKNIVTVGLRLKQFEWVEAFLNTYRTALEPSLRENAYTYNLAIFYYEQRLYSHALKLLRRVEFTDVYYNLSARALLVKVYYELEDDDALESVIAAYKVYMRRNKQLSGYQQKVNNNLLRFVKKLYKLRLKCLGMAKEDRLSAIAQLQKQIKDTQQIANINWLEKKVEELAS